MNKEKQFVVVNGIAFGEESKGNTVQALVRNLNAHTVWRSGGWQGGHHIIHDDGREIALSHFGAGVFEGADTYLNQMVFSPVELFQEALQLENLRVTKPLDQLFIDENCIVTTPFHSGISRTREVLRGKNKKGTIGKGVGEAIRDSQDPTLTIRARDFKNRDLVIKKIETIRQTKLTLAQDLISSHQGPLPEEIQSEIEVLEDTELVELVADSFEYASKLLQIVDSRFLRKLLSQNGAIVNEVSHGALHHPRYGFIPHVTQVDPTSADVLQTVRDTHYDGNLLRLGIVRSYLTRHGAGPFVSFDQALTQKLVETHNNTANDWLGEFKTGFFDPIALQYALAIGGGKESYDGLMVSYMDVLTEEERWPVVEAYAYQGKETELERYFEVEDGKIIGIKVHFDEGDSAHYEHQLKLTALLNGCLPVVTYIKPGAGSSLEEKFLHYIEDSLAVPVIGTAFGPKVTDRHFFPSWDRLLR